MSVSIPSLSTSTNSSSAVDQLVSLYIQSVSTPVYNLQSQQSQVNSQISILQKLKSSLSSLQTQASSLGQIGTLSPLAARTVSSSNSTVVTATATSSANIGTHSLLVTQLAKNDTLVSSQLTQSGTDISTATGAGTFTFSVTVNGTTTDVNVAVNSGDSNSTIMSNMATAVNSLGLGVTASVVNDTSSTARLVFQSKSSGSTNAISVADVTGTLAASVGWTSGVISGRTASTSTGAGYVNSSASSLDANFTLDGVPIVRGSNSVSDVLTGVTLNLAAAQQPTDTPVTLNVAPDTSAIQSTVQAFISAYNSAINTLKSDTTDTTSTDSSGNVSVTRAPLAGNVAFMNLSLSMQEILMGQVSSAQSGNPNMLSQVGITLGSDGTLSISDQSKFTSAVTTNPSAFVDLFNSSSGVAVQMNSLMQQYVQPGGTIDQEVNGAQDQVTALSNQISSMQNNINIQADAVRKQYTAYESLLIQLNSTQSSLNNIWSGMAASGMAV